MRITIKNETTGEPSTRSADREPILLHLSNQDRRNIAAMPDGVTDIFCYPDSMSADEAKRHLRPHFRTIGTDRQVTSLLQPGAPAPSAREIRESEAEAGHPAPKPGTRYPWGNRLIMPESGLEFYNRPGRTLTDFEVRTIREAADRADYLRVHIQLLPRNHAQAQALTKLDEVIQWARSAVSGEFEETP